MSKFPRILVIVSALVAFQSSIAGSWQADTGDATRTPPRPNKNGTSRTTVIESGHGTGQYDRMTYLKYSSTLTLVPRKDVLVESLIPDLWYCNGTCGFIAFIRTEFSQSIASEAGLIDGDVNGVKFPARKLDQAVLLRAGTTYRVWMDVWTTKSIGIYTTGERTSDIAGTVDYKTETAHSDTWNHPDRGAIAFLMLR